MNVPSEYKDKGAPRGAGSKGKTSGFVSPSEFEVGKFTGGSGPKGKTSGGLNVPMEHGGGLKIPKPGFQNKPAKPYMD